MELLKIDNPLQPIGIDISIDRILSSDIIAKQPAVLMIDRVAKFTKGNLSCISGVAKSKKTFGLTMMLSGLVNSKAVFTKFKPIGVGLGWIDTEQSPFDAQMVVKRIKKLTGSESGLFFYALRRYNYKDRVLKIESFLHDKGDKIDLLVIDGVRDLVADFNDPVESSALVTKIMQWSIDFNIHITVVLHANKGDGFMRGHLGTELENKAETVLKVERHTSIKDASIISEVFGRGQEIDEFMFKVNAKGLPELVDGDGFDIDDLGDGAPF